MIGEVEAVSVFEEDEVVSASEESMVVNLDEENCLSESPRPLLSLSIAIIHILLIIAFLLFLV